ncbi:MAG TPA: SRPBCC family protein [Polyangiaceae bacterium]
MTLDVTQFVSDGHREVKDVERDGRPARAVIATRVYDTDIEDLWNAVTTPERIARWFAPVEGELRLGGRYQIKGNASGTVTACDAPRSFSLTWEFGGGVTWVDLSLAAEGKKTRLTLQHTAHLDEHWGKFGPGAVGVGWDLGLFGLYRHIRTGESISHEEAEMWSTTDEGKRFTRVASDDWARAAIAAGEPEVQAREAAERTRKFYTGEA